MRLHHLLPASGLLLILLSSCHKEVSNDSGSGSSTANLVFRFKFDSTQARLNNIGLPSTVAAGNAAQSPKARGMSAHYLELAPDMLTALGKGEILYHAAETSTGGSTAIDFSKIKVVADGESFLSIPINSIKAGSYEWLRVSLAYQVGDIRFRIDTTIAGIPINSSFDGTLAAFIGFNTYIPSFTIATKTIDVNGNRKQGFWGFESTISAAGFSQTFTGSGQAQEGATTVPNPIFATSPIPQGSCVVTAAFAPGKLVITGNESSDIVVDVNLSTNKSFEWVDNFPNGLWEPLRNEAVVDMGIRGMIPRIQ